MVGTPELEEFEKVDHELDMLLELVEMAKKRRSVAYSRMNSKLFSNIKEGK